MSSRKDANRSLTASSVKLMKKVQIKMGLFSCMAIQVQEKLIQWDSSTLSMDPAEVLSLTLSAISSTLFVFLI